MENFSTRSGLVGGTFSSIVASIQVPELFRTAVFAAIGAGVSYLVSKALNWVFRRLRR